MKIELYLVSNDKNGILLKKFLERNNLSYKKIVTDDVNLLKRVMQGFPCDKVSLLRIRYSHHIQVICGFDPLDLKKLLEHIEKYKSKIEKEFKIRL